MHLKNTFQADLDTFKKLFSETKNSRLMTPAKFNRLQIIEEDQSNEQFQVSQEQVNNLSIKSDFSQVITKKCCSLKEALSKCKIKNLSAL